MMFNVEKQLKCHHLPIIENAKFFASYCKLTAMQVYFSYSDYIKNERA